MKNKLTAILMAAAISCAAGAARGGVGFGALANGWASDDFDDDPFFGLGARAVAELVPFLGVEARVASFGNSGDATFRAGDGAWTDYDCETDILSVEAGLVLQLPLGPLSLYGGGGVGGYFPDGELDAWKRHGGPAHRHVRLDYDSAFGSYAFAGLELSLAPFASLVGEFRYTWMETDACAKWHGETLRDDISVSFDGPGVTVGLMFWL